MYIKNKDSSECAVSQFDLLGYKETSICKAFAFVMVSDKQIFQSIMKEIFNINYSGQYFNKLSVNLEKDYKKSGRVDIELLFNDYHIIMEAKIGNNSVNSEQNSKYLDCFDSKNINYLCLLTENVPSNRILSDAKNKNVNVIYTSWMDIIVVLEKYKLSVVKEFLTYYEKGYKMKNIKEVLVQDLGDVKEVERYFNGNIYRTKVSKGIPLYFAPYFTDKVKNEQILKKNQITESGIHYFSEVVGVLTGKFNDVFNQQERIKEFAKIYVQDFEEDKREEKEKEILEKWDIGLRINNEVSDENTYYFLGEDVKINNPFKKDGGIEKGRGKKWIAAMISKNRCIPFKEFLKRLK